MSHSHRAAAIAGVVVAGSAMLTSTAGAAPLHSERALRSAIAGQMAKGTRTQGAFVVDLSDGHVVFADHAGKSLPTASLMKLYTTSTALMRVGTHTRLSTRVFATGTRRGGTLTGNLYLRGGGDFTFGNASFNRRAYGGGGTVQALAKTIRDAGITRIQGSVFGDASLFSDGTGTRQRTGAVRQAPVRTGLPVRSGRPTGAPAALGSADSDQL
jgi:serine-type D-Ala-D-Ala carboxypeptidase/endopeptidase (penicillin-binding protein 4)